MRIAKRAALKRFDLLDNLSRVLHIDAILDLYRCYNRTPYLTRADFISALLEYYCARFRTSILCASGTFLLSHSLHSCAEPPLVPRTYSTNRKITSDVQ